jgi:hypothetical protein
MKHFQPPVKHFLKSSSKTASHPLPSGSACRRQFLSRYKRAAHYIDPQPRVNPHSIIFFTSQKQKPIATQWAFSADQTISSKPKSIQIQHHNPANQASGRERGPATTS